MKGSINKLATQSIMERLIFSRRNECDDKFILIHTFSHVLIRQLTFECGYDASSLKERLYSGIDEDGTEMAGVLIYTASGDLEGSLGGLVERAKPEYFENTVRMAIEEAKFCSNDPICHETDRQGLEGYNVSAMLVLYCLKPVVSIATFF